MGDPPAVPSTVRGCPSLLTVISRVPRSPAALTARIQAAPPRGAGEIGNVGEGLRAVQHGRLTPEGHSPCSWCRAAASVRADSGSWPHTAVTLTTAAAPSVGMPVLWKATGWVRPIASIAVADLIGKPLPAASASLERSASRRVKSCQPDRKSRKLKALRDFLVRRFDYLIKNPPFAPPRSR